jgi:hypothetical protein
MYNNYQSYSSCGSVAKYGYIFYVSAVGQVETSLNSHAEKMNVADIAQLPNL